MTRNNCCRQCVEMSKMRRDNIPAKCFGEDMKNKFCSKAYIEKEGLRYFILTPCKKCTSDSFCYNFQKIKEKS